MKEIHYGEKRYTVEDHAKVVVVDGSDYPHRCFNGNEYFENGRKYKVLHWLYKSPAVARAIVQ